MSSWDLTAPFHEKNTVLSESLKRKSVSCWLMSYSTQTELGGRPTPPTWTLSTFTQPLTMDVPSHHPSTESQSARLEKPPEIIKSDLNDDRTVIILLGKMSH